MGFRLLINTQTPPVNPLPGAPMEEGVVWTLDRDYVPQLGGVVPMMRSLLGSPRTNWITGTTHWLALGAPGIPESVRTSEGYVVETLDLSKEERAQYGRFKEEIWRSFHGPRGFRPSLADYPAFVNYSSATAIRLLRHLPDTDVFYVHDFQQILVGGLIGSAAPALLHWHIPLDFRGYPDPVRRFFLKAMEGFDGIVVSTRAGLEDLIHAGFQGRAFQLYPWFNAREHTTAAPGDVERLRLRFRLGKGPVVVSVSRMDPVKRQDLLIEAIARVRRRIPTVKLLLVGGGSFSTQGTSGGDDKNRNWRAYLEQVVRKHRLESNVVFTGAVDPSMLRAAYDVADVFVHPAPWEGFGLVVIEAWNHRRPVIVSRGAGVAELVNDGINGYQVTPGQSLPIAQHLEHLLRRPEDAAAMGINGAATARFCDADRASPRLKEILERTIELYDEEGQLHRRRSPGWRG
jgi:glycosyltransferase involved in cell wall biosynthesis